MDKLDKKLLNIISGVDTKTAGVYNIRKNGKAIERKTVEGINIISKEDKAGIDIFVDENVKDEIVHIPVIITESDIKDVVYNDFYIGKNANITIMAGCGIHNDHDLISQHDGIHRFFLDEGAHVKYIEKHYGEGKGKGDKVLNPVTEITLKKGATLEMETVQIEGVNSSIRTTKAKLNKDTNLIIQEKIMTNENQFAKTIFDVKLNGDNASTHVTSRSVATDSSKQEFISKIYGNKKCFAHVECDAIVKDNAKVKAVPAINANNVEANLIHEAAIGKIAGEQLIKLMSLGLSEKEAEAEIIKGFLK